MRSARPLFAAALTFAVLATACERAADLIPGDVSPTPTVDEASAAATPEVASPIIPPATVTVGGSDQPQPAPPPPIAAAELARSVVQLQLFDTSTGFVRLVRDGSGVVVDRSARLILTSYLLVDPFREDGTRVYSTIAVGAHAAADEPPELLFEAEIVAAEPLLGLAVLRVTRAYRGPPLEQGAFDLPQVLVAENGGPEKGDSLRALGHRGLAGGGDASQAVLSAPATVLGFRGQPMVEGRAWMRIDARLPYGFSGAPLFDERGALVALATQLVYDETAVAGSARPLALAAELIERARRGDPDVRYTPPLQRRQGVPVAAAPQGGPVVGAPAFAENGVDGEATLDLFDYTSKFPDRAPALFYEYAVQGVADGALVEERWYLDGVLQDSLSSSYNWGLGGFAVVGDRLQAPAPNGIPEGVWVLEVWVDGVLLAAATADVGIEVAPEPQLGAFRFGARVSADLARVDPASSEARQLLAFFDYRDAGGVSQLRWIVFRDGRVVYESPLVPWQGGREGTWWVGYAGDGPVGAGLWEFEIYLDSAEQPQRPVSRGADGVRLIPPPPPSPTPSPTATSGG